MAESKNSAVEPQTEMDNIDLADEAGSLVRLIEALELACGNEMISAEFRRPLVHIAMLAADKATLIEHHLTQQLAGEART